MGAAGDGDVMSENPEDAEYELGCGLDAPRCAIAKNTRVNSRASQLCL